MLKALLKKQFLELNQYYFKSRKTGKHRTPKERRKYIVLLVVLGVVLLFSFGAMSLGISPMIVRGDDSLEEVFLELEG